MPVDLSRLAQIIGRGLGNVGDVSLQQQQGSRDQQRLGIEQQNEKLNERKQTLDEEMNAPTIDSWKAYKTWADSLPPDKRAEAYREVVIPGALKLQATQQAVDQERQTSLAQAATAMSKVKPEDQGLAAAYMQQIAGADNLVDLRTAVRGLNQLATSADKPPPLKFMPVTGGSVPMVGGAGGWTPGFAPPGGGAPSGGGSTMEIPGVSTTPGGAPFVRKLTGTETTAADTISQALDQIDALTPELENYAASSGPEPTSKLGKIGGAAERFGEFGAYKFGIDTVHGSTFTDASQLYAQIAGALTRTGPRSVTFLHELSPHIPKATDSPQLLLDKVRKWKQILQRDRAQLKAGPFESGGGAAPSRGGSAGSPSPSRSEASTGKGTPISVGGHLLGYSYDGGKTYFPAD